GGRRPLGRPSAPRPGGGGDARPPPRRPKRVSTASRGSGGAGRGPAEGGGDGGRGGSRIGGGGDGTPDDQEGRAGGQGVLGGGDAGLVLVGRARGADARGDERDVRADLGADGRGLLRGADEGLRARLDRQDRQPADGVGRRAGEAEGGEVRLAERRQHGHRGDLRGGGRVDGGADHRGPAGGVHGQVGRLEARDRAGGAAHGRRDVVQLEVQEDLDAARAPHAGDDVRPVPQVELQAHLDGGDVRRDQGGPARGRLQVGRVQRDGDGGGHSISFSGSSG